MLFVLDPGGRCTRELRILAVNFHAKHCVRISVAELCRRLILFGAHSPSLRRRAGIV
jgi:hypothetical protein